MLMCGMILVLAATNGLTISPWCWVLFGLQVLLEMVIAVAKTMKD